MAHLGLQRIMIPGSQVSALTTGNITTAGARGQFVEWGGPEGAYDALATVTVGATSVSTISFVGIPQTYKHLELRYIGRGSGTSQTFGKVSINKDTTTSNYRGHDLFGTGSSALASDYGGQTGLIIQKFPGTNSASNIFGAGVFTLLDYSSTSKYKTARLLGGQDSNGSGEIDFVSSIWFNASPVNSFDIVLSGGNFVQYSQFALYGVK